MARLPSRASRARAALVAVLLLATQGAQAAGIYCNAAQTRDGFVALRAAPDARAPIVARMNGGDEVRVFHEPGEWRQASYWRGGRYRPGARSPRKPDGVGWIASAVGDKHCFISSQPKLVVLCNLQAADTPLALRATAAADGRIVAALQPNDDLELNFDRKGDWLRVVWWRGERLTSSTPGAALKEPSGSGWMHWRLVGDSCGWGDP